MSFNAVCDESVVTNFIGRTGVEGSVKMYLDDADVLFVAAIAVLWWLNKDGGGSVMGK